jgi:DNA polymerase-1|tara:strand:+ start:289 stop:972 length:684 start_codon:yes stop_codon:yes gene_type:complete
MVIGDYATCELRILAEMSRDPVFLEAFDRGEDLHARVASSLFGKPVSKTQNSDLRHRAKAVNFGLVYGMGAGGLAHTLNLPTDQARRLLDQYFRTFPRIRAFLEESAQQAIERGFAKTLAGRRLYLSPGHDEASRAQAERIAKNMPIQGTSADITKAALGRVWNKLRPIEGAHLINTVHDEVVIECDTGDQEEVSHILTSEMKAAAEPFLPNVPMEVDAETSTVWAK